MSNEYHKSLYEKLYFHEIDSREHLNGRLQTPLAIIMSMIAVIAFMLQNLNKDIWNLGSLIFYLLFFLSLVFISVSIYFFIRSWYGNTYSFIPSAADTEAYRNELHETYASFNNGKELSDKYFDEYITNYFINCSSINTACNDTRSINLHKTNTFIIVTGITAFLTFISFYSFDLEKTSDQKTLSSNLEDKSQPLIQRSPEISIVVNTVSSNDKSHNQNGASNDPTKNSSTPTTSQPSTPSPN